MPAIKAAPSTRALSVRKDTLNDEARTMDVVFASENPVRSWLPSLGDYDEILDCTEQSCDLTRLLNGAQFLKEHDRHLVVGVVENARFENRLGVATLRFAKTALGEEEFQMAKDGIRRNFSVSFSLEELTPERVGSDDGDIYRATGWEPNEISVVSVEADTKCKALRSRAEESKPVKLNLSDTQMNYPKFRAFYEADNIKTGSESAPDLNKLRQEAAANARAEILKTNGEIDTVVESFKRADRDVSELATKAKSEGWTSDKFRAEAIVHLGTQEARKTVTDARIEIVRELPKNLRSVGEQIADSEAYKAARGTRKRAMVVDLPGVTHLRATGTTGTITGYNGITQVPGPIELGVQQAHVADLLSQGTTNLSSVPYLLEDSLTPAATSVAEGALKPEASWDWSQTSAPVIKIAVIGRVSDELFDDVPGMQSLVNNRLRYMVEIEEDDQLINGNGSGDMTGIINTSGVQTQALGGDTKPDAFRKAMTKVQSTGFFAPDGIVVHPNDWEQISLLKDSAGQYLAGGPFYAPYGNGQYVLIQRLWGLNVVVTTSCPEGTAIVGAFKLGAMIFRKQGITVDTTNSDGDDFKYNRIAIRVEERAALAVWRPKAFCLVTGI